MEQAYLPEHDLYPPSPGKSAPDEDHDEDDFEDCDESTGSLSGSPSRRSKKKRDSSNLRKAPQAPKRFKSSYICFFMAKQPEIKELLGDRATVTEISKKSADMWRKLPAGERLHWDEVAAKDKQRYMMEKASYTGPWQIPFKRVRKDPSAPKRPMSAFLYFSQGRRQGIKDENPEMKNTEVSKLLGGHWRNATEEERRPFIEKEKAEREKYKVAIAEWRKDFEKKKEDLRKEEASQMEQQVQWQLAAYPISESDPQGNQPHMHYPNYPPYGMPPSGPYGHYYPSLPSSHYPDPRAPHGAYPRYPPGPYPFPINGKQPVILGRNGMPHFSASAPSATTSSYACQQHPAAPDYDDTPEALSAANSNFDYVPDPALEPQTAG